MEKKERKGNEGQYEHLLFSMTFEFGTDACFFVSFVEIILLKIL